VAGSQAARRSQADRKDKHEDKCPEKLAQSFHFFPLSADVPAFQCWTQPSYVLDATQIRHDCRTPSRGRQNTNRVRGQAFVQAEVEPETGCDIRDVVR
jgi:hypothetical protein